MKIFDEPSIPDAPINGHESIGAIVCSTQGSDITITTGNGE